eukprot:1683440-Rhodomonas_salina.2
MPGRGQIKWPGGNAYDGFVVDGYVALVPCTLFTCSKLLKLLTAGLVQVSTREWKVCHGHGIRGGGGRKRRQHCAGLTRITVGRNRKFGKRHGEGVLLYDSDGKQKYEGEWCNDARHGFGTMQAANPNNAKGLGEQTYRSGNVYKGEWKDGQLHGQGQMMWYHKNEIYVGGWQNGLQH